jgi:flagellar protein FliJ
MQRFQFRLAGVLGWRALQLELEERKLEALVAERRQGEAEAERVAARRRDAERLLASDSIEGQELAALDAHRDSLARAAGRLRAAAAQRERRIAEQRARVLEADRRVRLLERLKERRLAAWEIEAARELDTLASETYLAKFTAETQRTRRKS